MKKSLLFLLAFSLLNAHAQKIDVKVTEDYSPYIFGHNLEHTRSAINGGLSAQMLKNRKFAGQPKANQGVCLRWFGIGEKVLFMKDNRTAYTKHLGIPNMHRDNERSSQIVQNLFKGQTAGIGQHELAVEKGKTYTLRMVTRVSAPINMTISLTDRSGIHTYASHKISLVPEADWTTEEFELTPIDTDKEASIRYTFTEKAELIIGALSMMPKDNFHGMRLDVVEDLKKIGPRLLRWPGGNFAGEYRWKDGLLPVDQRAPLQSYREIETHPHSDGYDYHEINTDDFIALCREVGAEPMLTINLAWESPEESAQWVEYCNGAVDTEYGKLRAERGHPEPYNVHLWSLGNEMGYGHMEGPKTAKSYTEYAMRHTEAMLKITPSLTLFASGPYPNDNWVKNSAAVMAEKVKHISLHGYFGPTAYNGGGLRFTTPEETKKTYNAIVESALTTRNHALRMRKMLDATGKKLHISYDEWNQWFTWYRPSCVSEGIYTARVLHFLLNESNALDIPVVCYFQPVGEGAILVTPTESRLTANGQMFAMMKAHQDGQICKVTENDDFSTTASVKDGVLTITLINAEYAQERNFSFPIRTTGEILEAKLYSSDDVTPFSYFTESALPVKATKKVLTSTLPPHSAAIIRVKVKQ